MSAALIEVTNLEYGHAAGAPLLTSPVTFSLNPGQIIAVIGQSGVGKSTLLHSLFKTQLRVKGDVTFPQGSNHSALKLGYMPQDATGESGLFTISDIVADGFTSHWGFVSNRDALKKAEASLTSLGLSDSANKRVMEISGGQQQRVLLARAMSMGRESGIILLDEPTANVDVETGKLIYETVTKEAATGSGFIIATHDLDFALNKADIVISLSHKRVDVIAHDDLESSGFLDSIFGEGL